MNKNGKVVTCIAEAGGVGKSTVCWSVASILAHKHNQKVLIIDMDGQVANISFFCGIKKNPSMATIFDVLMRETPFSDAVVNASENLDIIPANEIVASLSEAATLKKMRAVVKEAKEKYDWIFMDVTPTPNRSHVLSLATTEYVLPIATSEWKTAEGLRGSLDSITDVKEEINSKLQILGIVINQYNIRTNIGQTAEEATINLATRNDTEVIAKLHRDTKLTECVGAHEEITEYAPKSRAAQELSELTERIINKAKGE